MCCGLLHGHGLGGGTHICTGVCICLAVACGLAFMSGWAFVLVFVLVFGWCLWSHWWLTQIWAVVVVMWVMGLQGWATNGWWWYWRKRNRWCVTLHMSETKFLNEKQDKKTRLKNTTVNYPNVGQGIFWLTCWWQPVNVWFQYISVCLDRPAFHWALLPTCMCMALQVWGSHSIEKYHTCFVVLKIDVFELAWLFYNSCPGFVRLRMNNVYCF